MKPFQTDDELAARLREAIAILTAGELKRGGVAEAVGLIKGVVATLERG